MKPKQKYAFAYLRQLCCLGLPSAIVMNELLKAVESIIPSENNVFAGLDEHLMPTHFILEHLTAELAELAPIVAPNFFLERRQRIRAWLKQNVVLTDPFLIDDQFYKSDLYNVLWKKLDQHHFAQTGIVHSDRVVGLLCLYRPRRHQPFNSKEQVLCARLAPYLAHALQSGCDQGLEYSDNSALAMMVMDTKGVLLYLSETAQRLLVLTHDSIVSMAPPKRREDLWPKLTRLCRNLDALFQGKEAPPPSFSHTNAQGRFVFRAQWLNRLDQEHGRLIGITLTHQEPVKLKMLRGLHSQTLSPTQKEVALLLTEGLSSKDIGERLHIKPTTVKDHVGKIFTKLDIHQRSELLPKLLALDKSNSSFNRPC